MEYGSAPKQMSHCSCSFFFKTTLLYQKNQIVIRAKQIEKANVPIASTSLVLRDKKGLIKSDVAEGNAEHNDDDEGNPGVHFDCEALSKSEKKVGKSS